MLLQFVFLFYFSHCLIMFLCLDGEFILSIASLSSYNQDSMDCNWVVRGSKAGRKMFMNQRCM